MDHKHRHLLVWTQSVTHAIPKLYLFPRKEMQQPFTTKKKIYKIDLKEHLDRTLICAIKSDRKYAHRLTQTHTHTCTINPVK